jgi:UrcA family protein
MRTIVLTSAVLALAAASPAIAGPIVVEANVPTAHVSYADLDLGTSAGFEALQSRVRDAASRLCLESGRTDLARAMAEQKCYTTAVASAQNQITAARSSRSVAAAAAITMIAR